MDNPLTHKANSVPIHFVHLNGSMILLSRLSAGEETLCPTSLQRGDWLDFVSFSALPSAHAPKPNHSCDSQHGRRLGRLP
jgi:hypothetical protein